MPNTPGARLPPAGRLGRATGPLIAAHRLAPLRIELLRTQRMPPRVESAALYDNDAELAATMFARCGVCLSHRPALSPPSECNDLSRSGPHGSVLDVRKIGLHSWLRSGDLVSIHSSGQGRNRI